MGRGSSLQKRPDMVGSLNPRWARDGRVRIGQHFGSWTVLSDEPFEKCGALYVLAQCGCGKEREANLRFMETGRSVQCKGCATRQRHARQGHLLISSDVDRRLQKRVNAWFQRCHNPEDNSFHNYGGRGIECRFASVHEGVKYVVEYLPHPTYQKLDIDRINNDGHYEPGNLRLVTRKENLANRGRFVVVRMTSSTVDRTPGLQRMAE